MYIINSLPEKILIPKEMGNKIRAARKNGDQWIFVEETRGADYTANWELVDTIQKVSYRRGTKVYNRTHGFPYATVKKAVKAILAAGYDVAGFFDGNHDNINSSYDNEPYDEKVAWAVSALQWAGFQDPEVLCAYDPPYFAYEYEAKLSK